MNQRVFQIKNLVENQLCTGCGACVSESKSSYMQWDDNGFLVPKLDDTFNEKAIKICPFNPNPDVEVQDEDKLADLFLKEAKNIDKQIGRFENTYVGYSKEYRETSSSGGIATYVFEQLLKQKIVDYLYIVKELKGSYEYQLFSDVDQIKQISKTRYIPVTLEKLFLEIDKIDGKIAISGVACFIKAIRLKQYYNPELKEKIPFLIGIICGGLKSKFFTDYLAQKSGIKSNYHNQDYRIKDALSTASDYSFGAYNEENDHFQIKMREVGDMWGTGLFKSLACEFCTDVTTELADISLGDAWLHPFVQDGKGNNVVVTRSKLADKLIKNGHEEGDIIIKEIILGEFISSQSGGFNHRQKAIKYKVQTIFKARKIKTHYRNRFDKNIAWDYKRVIKLRLRTRELSLEIWKKTRSATHFENITSEAIKKLRNNTLFYHRLNKIKKYFKT